MDFVITAQVNSIRELHCLSPLGSGNHVAMKTAAHRTAPKWAKNFSNMELGKLLTRAREKTGGKENKVGLEERFRVITDSLQTLYN